MPQSLVPSTAEDAGEEPSLRLSGLLAVAGVQGRHGWVKTKGTFPKSESGCPCLASCLPPVVEWCSPSHQNWLWQDSRNINRTKFGEEEKILFCGKLENKTLVLSIDVSRENAVYLQSKEKNPNTGPWETSSSHMTTGELYELPLL